MSEKTYLKEQIRLVSLSSYDLFTDEEYDLYMQIVKLKNQLDLLDEEEYDPDERKQLLADKKKARVSLERLIADHENIPRTVRLSSVVYYPKYAEYPFPEGITYNNLKTNKKIAEFCCELSRAMGLKNLDRTLDLVVMKWKNTEILRQLVINGFYMPILTEDGVVNKHYRFFTASSGQLRTDKFMAISDDAWAKIRDRLECGVGWEEINAKGGINANKLSAYEALPNSATEEWTDFDIDRMIVVDDFEGEVTDRMIYIKPDYTWESGVKTVKIKHTDGCGMILPSVSGSNFMIRAPYTKGLLIVFDFIKFCKVNNVPAVVTDIYGKEHDLIKENIQIIIFKSMFKLWKYYNSWDEYKEHFKKNKCKVGKTNYEEDYLANKALNYQMIQTLTDFTDEEIKEFVKYEHDRIQGITKDKDAMLKTLRANPDSEQPYKAALALYPELLREAYSKESLKNIRKRMLLDAKSGKLKLNKEKGGNKRLFACPDLYGICEWLFCHDPNPKGLLRNGEVACKIFRRHDKVDVLRSPHLSMEHGLRNVAHDPNIYEWFCTNGLYSSLHDLLSRLLQLDWDGDQLNVVADPLFVSIAERNIKKYDVIPLFYDADTADAEKISFEAMYRALKRAHDFSAGEITSIGEISNMLTRLWNKDNPDRDVANLLTMFNNLVIDAAKSGKINHYKDYPQVAKRIGRATGGKNGRMPYWFKYSKNGRKNVPQNKNKKYGELNGSTMSRICMAFSDIGNINMNYAGIPQFNWQMLLSEPCPNSKPEIQEMFCEMDNANKASVIESQDVSYTSEKQLVNGYAIVAEDIINRMVERYGSLETVYPYIAKYLFAGEGQNKSAHKQMFWRVFGDIALRNIKANLTNCDTCPSCGIKIPSWVKNHICIKNIQGFYECIDCGVMCERKNPLQCRCEGCQEKYRSITKKARQRERRELHKELIAKRTTVLQSFSTET